MLWNVKNGIIALDNGQMPYASFGRFIHITKR